MVLQRFNAMHEKEEAQRREAREARERALDEQEGTPLLLDDGGGGMAAGGGGSPDRRVSLRPEGGESPNAQPLPREPLARRRERQRRLAEEQRKRIAEEEREKQTADATIRKLQARGRPARPPRPAAPPGRPARPPCPLALPSRPATRLPRLFPTSLTPRLPLAARAHPPARGERQAAAQGGGVRAQHRRDVRRDRGARRVPDTAPRTHRTPQLTPRPSLCRTWSSRRQVCGRRRRTRSR